MFRIVTQYTGYIELIRNIYKLQQDKLLGVAESSNPFYYNSPTSPFLPLYRLVPAHLEKGATKWFL